MALKIGADGEAIANGSLGSAFASGAAGLAAAEGLSLINSGLQYFNQKKLNRQAQKDTQQNMRLQQQLNLEAQYKGIADSTQAYRAAGLNPMLAFGAPSVAGVGVAAGNAGAAAAPQTPDAAAAMSAGVQLALADAQRENVEANTDLATEAAREKRISNDRRENEDYFISQHLPAMISHLENEVDDDFTRGWLDEWRVESKGFAFDSGVFDAFNRIFFEMTRQERNKALDELTNEMDIKVMRMQLNNGTAAALADLPKANRRLIYKNMLRMDAEIAHFRSQVQNLDADTEFFRDRQAQTEAVIKKLGQETLAILHNDKVALYDAGEIGALGLTLGFDAVNAFSSGAGFGAGAAVAGKVVGGKSSGLPAAPGPVKGGTLAKPLFESPKRVKLEPYGKPVPKEIIESIREAARATAKGDKVYEARLFDASVKRWKHLNGYK